MARHLGSLTAPLARPVFKKHGAAAALLSEWFTIAGADISDLATPLRIAFPRGERRDGTLHLATRGADAPVLQHLQPRIIERVNRHFGYTAVARLVLHHRPRADDEKKPEPASAERGPSEPIPGVDLGAVTDPQLRAALQGLLSPAGAATDMPPERHDSIIRP